MADSVDPRAEYFRSWDALGMMLSRGQSFSGLERDCVFLNTGGARFANISATTGLDLIDDGRALVETDWDRDGDLDVLVGNRTGPRIRLMRNDVGAGHAFLTLRLEGVTCNRDAVGARVEVELPGEPPRRLIRTLRAGDGYLSQSTKSLHFGLEKAARAAKLRVRWPDGQVQEFTDVAGNQHYRLRQGGELAAQSIVDAAAPLVPSIPKVPAPTAQARVVFTRRLPLPPLNGRDLDGVPVSLEEYRGRPLLVNLWASWCPPCREELKQWAKEGARLEEAGWKVVLACTDRVGESPSDDLEAAKQFVTEEKLPFTVIEADTEFVRALNLLHNRALYKERSLPLPTTFAIDREGKLACVYRGPVDAAQLVEDAALVQGTMDEAALQRVAMPFDGQFIYGKLGVNPLSWAAAYVESGHLDDARRKLVEWLESAQVETRAELSEMQPRQVFRAAVYGELAKLELQHGDRTAAIAAATEMVKSAPNEPKSHFSAASVFASAGNVDQARRQLAAAVALAPTDGAVLHQAARTVMLWGDSDAALEYLEQALDRVPGDKAMRLDRATILQLRGETAACIAAYRELLADVPDSWDAANNLAWLLATHPNEQVRDGAEAVRLAEAATQATGRRVPAYLGTLAAAYAEAGRFDEAVATAEEASALARATGEAALARSLQERREQYLRHEPFRDLSQR